MSEIEIARFVLQALTLLSSAAPGFLAAFASTSTDAEALERAARALATIPNEPARSGIERYRARLRGA